MMSDMGDTVNSVQILKSKAKYIIEMYEYFNIDSQSHSSS